MPTEAPSITAEILLLEQNIDDAALIQEAVENNHTTVLTECPDVLSFLRRQDKYESAPRPDLILLDLDLSRKADCEMLSEVKIDSAFRRIPVVVLASSASYADIFQAYDLHANAYICKPVDRDDFARVVRATLHFWLALARLPQH
jgi:two-component system, chemotaxis family, response regulator Rcp1